MGDKSGISWTTATWNPIVGCTKVSAGCDNCYAQTLVDTRMQFNPTSIRFGHPFNEVIFYANRLDQPLRWTKPRTIFVNSLSDLFHQDVTDAQIDSIFDVMTRANQHTYQVLTKRAERLERYMRGKVVPAHIWVGTSVEDDAAAWRIKHLAKVDATIRFLSIEPMIGPVTLTDETLHNIEWVIVGGESGAGARDCQESWLTDAIAACTERNVPIFVKQMGTILAKRLNLPGKGDDPTLWPEYLRVQQMPVHAGITTGGV